MYVRRLLFFAVISSFAVSGCMDTRTNTTWSERRPLAWELGTFQPPKEPPPAVERTPEVVEPNGVITLRRALGLALMRNPELGVFSWEVRAAEAQTLQAGLWPNPEIKVEAENIGGTIDLSSFDGAEQSSQQKGDAK